MMDLTDRATTITFLLRDRDSRFTRAFDAVFTADGIRILTSPPGAPRANAVCERMIGTLRRELLDSHRGPWRVGVIWGKLLGAVRSTSMGLGAR
jgi:transposase InsO family protein